MSADDALLYIDANKYLDLYRTDKGKKLLAPLGEQVEHIFVTQQTVDEVQRNKIHVTATFLAEKFKSLKLQTFNVPDHLSGSSEGRSKQILNHQHSSRFSSERFPTPMRSWKWLRNGGTLEIHPVR